MSLSNLRFLKRESDKQTRDMEASKRLIEICEKNIEDAKREMKFHESEVFGYVGLQKQTGDTCKIRIDEYSKIARTL